MIRKAQGLIFDLLSVFTWSKGFKHNQVLGNFWLNRLGLHCARLIVAHILFRFRLLLLSSLVEKHFRREFIEQGYLVVRDIFPQLEYQRLREEFLKPRDHLLELVEGTTLTQRVFLDSAAREQIEDLDKQLQQSGIIRLMRWCGSKNRWPLIWLENLCNHANVQPQPDPQRDPHIDTFHPCVKAWVYFDASSEHNGPFVFAKGSHRLMWKRLKWEYQHSLLASRQRSQPDSSRYWDGSFRVSKAELADMGYTLESIELPENSLLIANVHGFHCRGVAREQSNRLTLWMQMRDNPFNPFFLPAPKCAGQLVERFWKRHLARERAANQPGRVWRSGAFLRYDKE